MKITTITHKPPTTKKPALNFLKSKQDHPHTIEREYMKALNSVKLDKLFAKPFIKQISLNDGITFLQLNPENSNELLALTYSNELSIINIRNKEIKTVKFDFHIKSTGFYYKKDNETRIFITTMNDIHILNINIFEEEKNNNRKYLLRQLTKPKSLNKVNEFNFLIRSAYFCNETNKLYLATDLGLIIKRENSYINIFNKEIDLIKVSKEVIVVSFNNILYIIDSITYLLINKYQLSIINDISISNNKISVACEDNKVYLIDIKDTLNKEPKIFLGHTHPVTSCYLFINNKINKNILITGSFDKSIRIFNIKTRKSDILYSQRMSEINSIIYSDINELIISGSNDGSIRIWKEPNQKMGLLNKKQLTDLKHRKLLINKFSGVNEIAVIERSKNLPKELKGNLKNNYEHRKKEERREKKVVD